MFFIKGQTEKLLELTQKNYEFQVENISLKAEIKKERLKTDGRYVRIKTYEHDDPNYIEGIAALLDDDRFTFFLEDTMHDFIDIIRKIEPGDPESEVKRTRAAYRMDGIQFLINKISEIRARHLTALAMEKNA